MVLYAYWHMKSRMVHLEERIMFLYEYWQAKSRMVHLEESIMQAQNRESQIIDFTHWMAEVAELIQARLDADILAGDVPSEYEVYTKIILYISGKWR